MEGNHLIPSAAEFARAFDEPFPRVCPDCRGTGLLALDKDGRVIHVRELSDKAVDVESFEECGRCSGEGYIYEQL